MTHALALVLVLWQSAHCAGSGNITTSLFTNSTVSNSSSCEAGRLWDASRNVCSPCLPGTYKGTAGAAGQCDRCPSGKFSTALSSTSCQDCPEEAPYSEIGSAKCRVESESCEEKVAEGCLDDISIYQNLNVSLFFLGLTYLGVVSRCSFGPKKPETIEQKALRQEEQRKRDEQALEKRREAQRKRAEKAQQKRNTTTSGNQERDNDGLPSLTDADTAHQQPPAVFPMNAAPLQQVPQQIEVQLGFPQQGPPGGLPHGSEACVDQDGRTNYQNHFTQQTQWEHPVMRTATDERRAEAVRQKLADMGFAGTNVDDSLLRACDYDVSRVIDHLPVCMYVCARSLSLSLHTHTCIRHSVPMPPLSPPLTTGMYVCM